MAFEPECSASVLSHAFQMLGLHRGGATAAKKGTQRVRNVGTGKSGSGMMI